MNSAFKEFTEVLRVDPSYLDALIGRGLVYYNKAYTKAIMEYKKIFELDWKNKRVYYYLGQSYYANAEYNKAIKVLEKASREGPYLVDSLNYLGLAYEKTGKTNKTLEVFQAALRIAPHQQDTKNPLYQIRHQS